MARRARGGPLPGLPGDEPAGEAVALGPDVTGFAVGDRIASFGHPGAYAELALAPARSASRITEGVSAAQAVALIRGGHVALAALDTASHIGLSRPRRHGGPRAGRVKSVGRRANGRTLLAGL